MKIDMSNENLTSGVEPNVAGVEIIFFTPTCIVLWFGFETQTVLVTLPCFCCCWTVFAVLSFSLFLTLPTLQWVGWGWARSWEEHRWDTWLKLTKGIFTHMTHAGWSYLPSAARAWQIYTTPRKSRCDDAWCRAKLSVTCWALPAYCDQSSWPVKQSDFSVWDNLGFIPSSETYTHVPHSHWGEKNYSVNGDWTLN